MAETLAELGFTKGLEVGTLKGEHAEILCKTNPNLTLYCVDAWQGYKGYRDYLDGRLKRYYEECKERLSPYNAILIKKFSMDAVKDFEDNSLDFVYIDGAHDFINVAQDIHYWYQKVKPNGIMFGHDFGRSKGKYKVDVVDVVQAYAYSQNINPWFILGMRGKSDGLYREGVRSWMWVKNIN